MHSIIVRYDRSCPVIDLTIIKLKSLYEDRAQEEINWNQSDITRSKDGQRFPSLDV